MSKNVKVNFLHHKTDAVLTLEIPDDTRFEQLTKLLYKENFVLVQKPGYRYIVQGHIAGNIHTLRDYMPDGCDEITLRIFGQGQVLL